MCPGRSCSPPTMWSCNRRLRRAWSSWACTGRRLAFWWSLKATHRRKSIHKANSASCGSSVRCCPRRRPAYSPMPARSRCGGSAIGSAACAAPGRAACAAGTCSSAATSACRSEQFPRIDPAIIVLVTDGERALLGRQASWPAGRYSTVAGFVEPGESLEDAVAREVHEETGVSVHDIRYHSSQPWPFPSSIMLGFTATAVERRHRAQPTRSSRMRAGSAAPISPQAFPRCRRSSRSRFASSRTGTTAARQRPLRERRRAPASGTRRKQAPDLIGHNPPARRQQPTMPGCCS